MVAGEPNVDYPGADTGLSVLPLGSDEALTSRVRRVSESYLYVTPPRSSVGDRVPFVARDMLELSWQSDDGLRSVSAEAAAFTDEGLWRLTVTGSASRLQRRDSVRAPIGLNVSVQWDSTVLTGSTVDLSEGGLLCVFRPNGDLGGHIPYPKKGQPLLLTLDLYSDELVSEVSLVRRRQRQDNLHEWSMRFLGLPEPAADLIRSHVFTALRNARARRLTTLY